MELNHGMLCPCCSEKLFTECCGPFLSGMAVAQTPEALMRSRYSAFATGEIDYIKKTMKGKALKTFDREATEDWIAQNHWHKLEVLEAPEVTAGCNQGFVEFIAHYCVQGEDYELHECSKFLKEDNRWYYVGGSNRTHTQTGTTKIGRNDPCPCGSGAKYKKCCAS